MLIIFVVLKPVLKMLAARGKEEETMALAISDAESPASSSDHMPMLSGVTYATQLEMVQTVAKQEPHRVANIVKGWVENDG